MGTINAKLKPRDFHRYSEGAKRRYRVHGPTGFLKPRHVWKLREFGTLIYATTNAREAARMFGRRVGNGRRLTLTKDGKLIKRHQPKNKCPLPPFP